MAKLDKVKQDAQTYFSGGKWDKALQAYSALTKMDPKDPKNFQKVADLQLKIGRNKDAIESYKQACDVYMSKGFLIQAIAMCKMVMQMDPSQKEIEGRLAELYSKRGVGGTPGPGAGPAVRGSPTPAAKIASRPAAAPEQQVAAAKPPVAQAAPLPQQKPIAPKPGPKPVEIEPEEVEAEAPPAKAGATAKGNPPATKSWEIPSDSEDDGAPELVTAEPAKRKPPPKPKAYALPDSIDEDAAPDIAEDEKIGASSKETLPRGVPDTIEPISPPAKKRAGLPDLPPLDLPPLDTGASSGLGDLPPLDTDFGPPGEVEIPLDDALPPMEAVKPEKPKPAPKPAPKPEPKKPAVYDLSAELEKEEEAGVDIDVMGEEPEPEPEPKPKPKIKAAAKVEEEVEIPLEEEPEPEIAAEPELAPSEPPEEEKPAKTSLALDEEWEEAEAESPAPPSGEELLSDVEIEDFGLFPEIPLFKDLGKNEFQSVVRRLQSRSFKKGETLITEGEEGDSIFIIASGQVTIFKKADGGEKKIELGTLREGDFFGEFGYFAGSKRQASVVVMEDTDVLEMSREDMDAAIAEFPQVEQVLEKFYKERVMENILATSMLFRELSLEERRNIAQRFQLTEMREGEDIVVEGAEGDSMYLIRAGEVLVHTTNPMGEKISLAELAAGDFFGEVSLILGKPRTATVTANSPVVELMQLAKPDLEDIIEQHPDILENLKQVIAQRTEATVNKVSILDLGDDDLELGSLL